MKKISICIPTYEMHGKGKELLSRALVSVKQQTYTNFDVVISDNSDDEQIKNLCEQEEFKSLTIQYFKNPRKGMAPNTNESIKKATGELVKILYMDDYFAHENALKNIVESFTGHWLVTGCGHTGENHNNILHYPKYNKKIYRGENTIGSPSVLTIRNKNPLLFDEQMTWLLDCDYYKRMHDLYGLPVLLNDINIIIGTGDHQTTHVLPESVKKSEHSYMAKKYKKRLLYWLGLW